MRKALTPARWLITPKAYNAHTRDKIQSTSIQLGQSLAEC